MGTTIFDTRSIILTGANVFDGTGRPSQEVDVWVDDGRIRAMERGLASRFTDRADAPAIVDVTGCWVTPGFIDLHTHYEAEIELAPSLGESVRHGITTALVGSCGLSFAVGDPEDLADIFCRVEGIPREDVLPQLEASQDWSTPAEYLDHLERRPLGPNVVALLGHSAIRAHVMGLGRSVDDRETATDAEVATMTTMVDEALDSGYLGLSINTLPWDKMDGDRYRSRPTPSVFARWSEYRALAAPIRRRGALFQGVPDIQNRWNFPLFFALASGVGRRPLKTMLISMADPAGARGIHRLAGATAVWARRLFRSDVRFQSLPNPFDMYIDGLENPIIEEMGAGTEALHLDRSIRSSLLTEPGWRRRFAKQWKNALAGRVYHRDLSEARIIGAPDASLVGRTFAEVASERGVSPIEAFMDLQTEFGNDLRWYTVIANDRPHELRWIVDHPQVLIGFSDAGAHLRNMGFYNFPLRLLHMVRESSAHDAEPFMTVERAVHRVTGELARYLGIDAGELRVGARADVTIIDPSGLTDAVDEVHESAMPTASGIRRLVRRNDDAVRGVIVNGRWAYGAGEFHPALGIEPGFGRLLRGRY